MVSNSPSVPKVRLPITTRSRDSPTRRVDESVSEELVVAMTSYNPQLHPFNIARVPDAEPPAHTPSVNAPEARVAAMSEPRLAAHAGHHFGNPSPTETSTHGEAASEHESHEAPRVDEGTWSAPAAAATVPSAPEPSPEQRQAIELVARMTLVAQETKAALNERLAEFDLNDIRYSVLSIVREAAAEGCSQSMLAQKLRQSESSISTLVDRMRTSGLLYRLRSKTDRRKRYLTLTERGRDLLTSVDHRYGECVDDILSGLSAEDRTIFSSLLGRLLDRLDGKSTTPIVHTPAA